MLERFLIAKASDCIYQSRKSYQETYLLIFRRSETRPAGAFLDRQNRILSQKKRPAGAFWADTLAC